MAGDKTTTLIPTREELRPVQYASQGVGRLFQRDYVGVVAQSRLTPEALLLRVRKDFPCFSPRELAVFSPPHGSPDALDVGDTMHVLIRGHGHCGVVCTLVDDLSFTVRTLQGHLEAGTNTFGACYDAAGRIVCRIRARSRIRDRVRYAGYLLLGIHAQTRIWTTFVERMAAASGGRIVGEVMTSTEEARELPIDRGEEEAPTFRAADATARPEATRRPLHSFPPRRR